MKVAVLFAYAALTTTRVTCAAIQAPTGIISLGDITENDRKTLELLNGYYSPTRPKRSHEDPLTSLKASIGQGIKSKLSLLAKGSAAASSKLSAGSSGHKYYDAHDHHEYDNKSLDFWTLKKSILNTLLQAVKALKGGVIAIKGQLIKGSGYLISAKGKLISAKGEAITKLGKNIATQAVLSSPHGYSADYHHDHFHHSGPPDEYGSPSAPGPEYEVPDHPYHHHPPHHEDNPDPTHAGIFILKKIPAHDHDSHLPIEHKVPDFKPIKHKGPSFGEIIGKFFSASTSLKPEVPTPFGDEEHHDDHSHYYHHDHDHDHYHSDHSSQSSFEEYHPAESSHHVNSNDKPKETGLFEDAPAYLNIAEYASETKGSSQVVAQTTTTETPKLEPQNFDATIPLSSISDLDFGTSPLLTDYNNKPNYFIGTFSNQPNTIFPPLQDSFLSTNPTVTPLQWGSFPGNGVNKNIKYATLSENVGPQVFPEQDYFDATKSQSPYSSNLKYSAFLDSFKTSPRVTLNRPSRSKNHNHDRFIYPSPQLMKTFLNDQNGQRSYRRTN